jgi:hypothetical protein
LPIADFGRAIAVGCAMLALTGCAKFPVTAATQHTRLIFTMTVAGHIRDGSQTAETPYIYLVAVNPSTDLFPTTQGPQPVIAPPWGNGLVAGGVTHFISYSLQQSPHYFIYKFTDPGLSTWGPVGAPLQFDEPNGTATIRFEIDTSQIAPSLVNPDTLQSVQVNFLTMNRQPQGNDTGSKFWDALGNGTDPGSVNDYVRIPLTASQTFTNADFQDLEPQGDVPDPDLDIVNWSVEVRKP